MIDESRLRELVDDFGADDFADLVEVFLEEVREGLEPLPGLMASGTEQALRERFHFLKGCARNIGATRMSEICETFETAPGGFTAADLTALQREFDQVAAYFAARTLPRSA